MSNNLNFEHEGFTVNISYNSATNSVKRTVSDEGSEIYQDEINFDTSIVAEFDLMAEEEQEKQERLRRYIEMIDLLERNG